MRKLIVYTLVFSLVILGVGVYSAGAFQGKGGPGNRIDDEQRPYFQQEEVNAIDLNEEQIDEVEELKEEFFDNKGDLIEELQDKRLLLREAILEEEDGTVTELEDEISELRTEIDEARTDYLNSLKSILTEEQIEMISENDYRMALGNMGFNYNNRPASKNGYNQMQSRSIGNSNMSRRGRCY